MTQIEFEQKSRESPAASESTCSDSVSIDGKEHSCANLPSTKQARLAYIAVFALSLLLNVWFNFVSRHVNCADSADASEYIRIANGLLSLGSFMLRELPQHGLALFHSSAWATQPAITQLQELAQGGAVFPGFIAAAFAFAGNHDTAAPVLAQCILSATAAVFVTQMTNRIWGLRVGIGAGVLQALYPGFIINTGRLYSESFALFLFCAVAWLNVRGIYRRSSYLELFLLGAGLHALELTRSIDLLLWPLCAGFALWNQPKRRTASACAIAAGALAVLLPWMALQSIALGKSSLLVDRVAYENTYVGNDFEHQGWLSFPYQNMANVEHKSVTTLLVEGFKANPKGWIWLTLGKPVRLFKFPWNDFFQAMGPITFQWQVLFHQLLLLLGLTGVVLSFTRWRQDSDGAADMQAKLFLLGTTAATLAYILFITCARYNLQAMSVACMFASMATAALASFALRRPRPTFLFIIALTIFTAAARTKLVPYLVASTGDPFTALRIETGIKSVLLLAVCAAFLNLLKSVAPKAKMPVVMTMLIFLSLFPCVCLALRDHGRWNEWLCPFDQAGQALEQTIRLPSDWRTSIAKQPSYLLVDANGLATLSQGCEITVNGVKLSAPVIPGLALIQNQHGLKHIDGDSLTWEGEFIFDCMNSVMRQSNSDMRQWLLVPITQEAFSQARCRNDQLHVVISRSKPLPGAIIYGTYRCKQPSIMPALDSYSWEKSFYGVENDEGITDPRFDTRMTLHPVWRTNDLSACAGTQNGAYSILLLSAPDLRTVPSTAEKLYDTKVLTTLISPAQHGWQAAVTTLPQYETSDMWLIRTEISARQALKAHAIHFDLAGGNRDHKITYRSTWLPRGIRENYQLPFVYTTAIEPAAFPGKLTELKLTLNVSTESNTGTNSDAQPECAVSIWRIPSNPLQAGFKVF